MTDGPIRTIVPVRAARPYGPRPQRLLGASGKGMPFGGETKKAKRSRSAWTKIIKARAEMAS